MVEVNLPPNSLQVCFYAKVVDAQGVPPTNIMKTDDELYVVWDIWVRGPRWRLICGCWCVDLRIESNRSRPRVHALLGDREQAGCSPRHGFHGWRHCHFCYRVCVPPHTIPTDKCSSLYLFVATFQLLEHSAIPRPSPVQGSRGVQLLRPGDHHHHEAHLIGAGRLGPLRPRRPAPCRRRMPKGIPLWRRRLHLDQRHHQSAGRAPSGKRDHLPRRAGRIVAGRSSGRSWLDLGDSVELRDGPSLAGRRGEPRSSAVDVERTASDQLQIELAKGPERRRRTVVEQTEVDVNLVQSTDWDGWEGWECSCCEWMRRHLEEEPAPPDEESALPEEASVVEAESTPAPPAPPPAYRLVRVTLVDPQGRETVVPGNGSSVPVRVAGVERVKVELAATEEAPQLVRVTNHRGEHRFARLSMGPSSSQPVEVTVDVESLAQSRAS